MRQRLSEQITGYRRVRARRNRWRKVVTVLSCIVVFCTTYALILPALTLTQTPGCGREAHAHDESCYETQMEASGLHCEQPSHSHSDACYGADGSLICGYSDFVIHKHDANCFSSDGDPICTLPEIPEHAHTDSCYAEETELVCGLEESEGHRHSEQCYEQKQVLSCGLEESEEHTHGADCYTEEISLVCGKEEQEPHTHAEECKKTRQSLICTQREAIPHEHTEACYTNGVLACGKVQTLCHQHGQACFDSAEEKKVLICGQEEHRHDASCYDVTEVPEIMYHCGMGEHTHKGECYDESHALICSIPEHVHTEDCVDKNVIFGCGLPEHTHTETCRDAQGTLLCQFQEHKHDQSCIAMRSAPPETKNGKTFTYTDESSGLTASLTLLDENIGYTPEEYSLRIRIQDAADYQNILNSFAAHGHTIEETAIYKIDLVRKDYNDQSVPPYGKYELVMNWQSGLFAHVEPEDELKFYYCRNPKSQPTEPKECQPVLDENGNVASLTVSDDSFPHSTEFLFVRLGAPDQLIAGNYDLQYNDVKDRFMRDPKYSKYYNSNSPLGTAGSFHIVAFDTATLSTHTNGNVLAKKLFARSNFGTNQYPHELSYIQEYAQVHPDSASGNDHVLAIGSGNTVDFTDNGNAFSINGTKISRPRHLVQDRNTEQDPFIDLNRVRGEIERISARLSGFREANLDFKSASELQADHSKLILRRPSGVGVESIHASELASKFGGKLQIDGFQSGHNGTVIINVDCAGVSQVYLPQARVVLDGQEQGVGEVTEFYAGKVIWNFVNAGGVTIHTHLMTGAVIAPGATVNIGHNLNGTVVADRVNVNAESHRTDFLGKITEPQDPGDEPEPDERHIFVQKVETGNVGVVLPGAEFDLFKWEGTDWEKVHTADPWTTGSNGTIKLTSLEPNVAYKLVETKAPTHYVLKSDPVFFWMEDKDHQPPYAHPDDFNGRSIENGGHIQISNDKSEEDGISVIVKKLWKAKDGSDLMEITVPSIEINIYQIPDGNENAKTVYDKLTLSAENGWEQTLTGLPLTGENTEGQPVTYDYSVEEIPIPDFEVNIEREGNIFIITNTRIQSDYVLPETGGPGSALFTLSGALMLAAGFLLGCSRRRKGERRTM